MFVFKILLIILIALPVIALASLFYSQMLAFIKERNAIEDEAIRQVDTTDPAKRERKAKKAAKKEAKKAKKERKK